MTGIEDKDKAIRTYAGLPQIDNDIRKLGVGGGTIIGNSSYKNIPNDLLQRISEIELDVSNRKNGIFFIELIQEDKKFVRKIIKKWFLTSF